MSLLLGVFDGFETFFETVGVQIIECLAIFVLGVFIIRIIKHFLKKSTLKSSRPTLANFLISCLNVFLYIILFYIIFSILGISTASFIAAISAAGLAIALSLKDSLGNLASGVLIVTTKPFVEGDYILVKGVEGTVKFVKMFTTTILTIDNKEIVIPNSAIISNEVTNFSARSTRRIDLDVYVAYGSDIDEVKKVLLDVMNKHPNISKNPEPFARLNKYGESSLEFRIKAWVSSSKYWDTYYDLMELFSKALAENNIKVPFTTQEIIMHTEEDYLPKPKSEANANE